MSGGGAGVGNKCPLIIIRLVLTTCLCGRGSHDLMDHIAISTDRMRGLDTRAKGKDFGR